MFSNIETADWEKGEEFPLMLSLSSVLGKYAGAVLRHCGPVAVFKGNTNPTIMFSLKDIDNCHQQLSQTAKKNLSLVWRLNIPSQFTIKSEDLIKHKYDINKPHVLI